MALGAPLNSFGPSLSKSSANKAPDGQLPALANQRYGPVFASLRAAINRHPIATAVYFSPTFVLVGIAALEDYACVTGYLLDPYLGYWHSLAWLVITTVLIQGSPSFTKMVVGDDPRFGSRILTLSIFSLFINGVFSIPLLIAYRLTVWLVGSPC